MTTKDFVVRRALFVKEGDRFGKALVDESARSLRSLRQLSLVVVAPVHGSHDDTVRLVVITKDVWSLYVDFDLALTGGGLESLTLEPKETNIAGIHHVAMGRFVLEPKTVTAGASYSIPRLDGRWLSLTTEGNAIFNRDSGDLEGGTVKTRIQRPLFSSRTEWAWSVDSSISNRIQRRYVDAEVATFTNPDTLETSPWQWRERVFNEEASLTRSFGWAAKNDFTPATTPMIRSFARRRCQSGKTARARTFSGGPIAATFCAPTTSPASRCRKITASDTTLRFADIRR